MTDAELDLVAETLNRLPFVRWDRFVEIPPEYAGLNDEGAVDVYGWIDRPDGRADFVLVTFPTPIEAGYFGFTTSSAARSEEIGVLLFGDRADVGDGHIGCQRVDEVFGDRVVSKVVRA